MAKPYTELNPDLPGGENTQNTLRSSEGYQADTSTAVALKGGADVLEMGIKTADQAIKLDIKDRAYKQIDAVRDEFGVGPAATIQGVIPTKEVPEDLQRSMEGLRDVKRGYQQGIIGESTYWARMESISRQLRSRYAGHRAYIDDTISGITGGTPANKLVAALRQEAAKGSENSEERRRYEYIKQNERFLPEGYHTGKADKIYYDDYNVLRDFVAKQKRLALLREERDANIKSGALTREEADKVLARSAKIEVNSAVSLQLDPQLRRVDELVKKAQDEEKSGIVSPTTSQELTRAVNEAEKNLNLLATSILKQPIYLNLPDAAKKSVMEEVNSVLSIYKNASISKDWGSLNAAARSLKLMQEGTDTVVLSSDFNKVLASAQRNFGPQVAAIIFGQERGAVVGPKAIEDTLKRMQAMKVAIGSTTPERSVEDLTKGGINGAGVIESLKYPLEALKDPKATPAFKNATINNYFKNADSADRLLRAGPDGKKYTPETRRELFKTLVNPDVTKVVQELNDPIVQRRYGEWASRAFAVTYSSDISDLGDRGYPKDSIKITFNPTTLKFAAEHIPVGPGVSPAANMPRKAAANSLNGVTLRELNGMIETLAPVWKASGLDPIEQVRQLHMSIPKSTTIEGFVSTRDIIDDAINRASESIQGTQGKTKAPGGSGNDLIQSFINSKGEEVPLTRDNVAEFIAQWSTEVRPSLSANMELEGARVSTNIEDVTGDQKGVGRFAAPELSDQPTNFRNPTIINDPNRIDGGEGVDQLGGSEGEDTIGVMQRISNFFGLNKPKTSQVDVPARTDYPGEEDVALNKENDTTYGSVAAGFTEAGRAKIRQIRLMDELYSAFNSNKKSALEPELVDKTVAKTISKAWTAVQRNPVAMLGFDPRVMSIGVDMPKMTSDGMYSPSRDEIVAIGAWSESAIVHESIHRGIERLKSTYSIEVPGLINEYATRYLMNKYYGDVEVTPVSKGQKGVGNSQIEYAKWLYKNSTSFKNLIKELESKAIEMQGKTKGPR
jgi:Ca2+-binding RTX toxin-like protein